MGGHETYTPFFITTVIWKDKALQNIMITEDYCSLEVSKLLKEKGFDEFCEYEYGVPKVNGGYVLQRFFKSIKNSDLIDEAYTAPTLQMAMKWLREVCGIYPDIAVEEIDNTTFFRVDGIYLKQKKMWDKYNNLFKTYEEACEAAIKYCLENFI